MALRPCIGCRRLIANGSRCPQCKLRRPRGNAWQPTRTLVFAHDGHRCRDCGAPANAVDHSTPIARDGTDHPSNLQALCAACNSAKGDR
jgi:5-methylcytosine-specific restriction endonuclease McrA